MTVTGAYGVRLSGLGAGTWLGVNEALHWPELACKEDSCPEAPEMFLDIHALELRVRADIAHSELVHPLLGRVLPRSRWRTGPMPCTPARSAEARVRGR